MGLYLYKEPYVLTSRPNPGDCVLVDDGRNSIHIIKLGTETYGKGVFISPQSFSFGTKAGSRCCHISRKFSLLPDDRCLIIDGRCYTDISLAIKEFLKSSVKLIEESRSLDDSLVDSVYLVGPFYKIIRTDPVVQTRDSFISMRLSPWSFESKRIQRIPKMFQFAESVPSGVLDDIQIYFDELWNYSLYTLRDYVILSME